MLVGSWQRIVPLNSNKCLGLEIDEFLTHGTFITTCIVWDGSQVSVSTSSLLSINQSEG